jgi:hypothetical protein
MNYSIKIFFAAILVMATIVFYSCSSLGAEKKNQKEKSFPQSMDTKQNATEAMGTESSADCDSSLWRYVYDNQRLKVLDKCKVVTGIIEETNSDPDGDQHMLLKLDKGQKALLTKKNDTKKGGYLVIEAVCINKITRKRAKGACNGYVNKVLLPKKGDHVKVTGSYVIDLHNGWAEIHPISSIEKLK